MAKNINKTYPLAIVSIAKVCHASNKAWCESNGDESQVEWEKASEQIKESAIKGVVFKLNHPNAGNDAQHNAWMESKVADGWVYGEVKDEKEKTHPCLVPYDQLPLVDQKKDEIFRNIVEALRDTVPLDDLHKLA